MKKRLRLGLGMIGWLVGLAAAAQANPPPLYELPGVSVRVYASSSLVLAADGRTLIVANSLANTVSIIDAPQRLILAEIPVGTDPRAVALTPDNTRALVVNRADGALSVIDLATRTATATYPVGALPYAVVSNDNRFAYVSLQGTDEVVQVEIATGNILARIPVPDSPAGLTVWGNFLYTTHFWSGQVSLIYLPQLAVARTVSLGDDLSLSQSLVINPNSGLAYLPQSRSYVQNPYPTYDTRIFPVLTTLDLNALTPLDSLALDRIDRPVNMPFTAALGLYRNWLYVVNAGSNDLTVIDLNTGATAAHIPVGANPCGVVLNSDGSALYIHNVLDATITVIETYTMQVTATFPVSNITIPVDQLIGAQLFHSAADARLSRDHWISCASCHFDGQSDGRVWSGLAASPRNTPVLFGLADTAPYTWTGDWDELADAETHIRVLMAGSGFTDLPVNAAPEIAYSGLSIDLDLLAAYVLTLESPSAPVPADPATAERGAVVFAAQNCADCHQGAPGTDGLPHDVGTGVEFDTPTLNWLWLSPPYFHDGRAATLRDVFWQSGAHQLVAAVALEDIDALVVYLNSR